MKAIKAGALPTPKTKAPQGNSMTDVPDDSKIFFEYYLSPPFSFC